jgi:hypothetical protein
LLVFTLIPAKPIRQAQGKQNTTHQTIQLAVCIFAVIALFFVSIQANGFGLSIAPTAEKGADFFISNHLKGPIFNDFDIGSYLDYRLYPRTKVFVDSRPEAYPASFFQQTYIPMQQDPKIFAQEDEKYHFQSIFFSYTDQTPWAQAFMKRLVQNPQWQLVYVDTFSAIWVKKDGTNKYIALTHPITQQNFSLPQDTHFGVSDYYKLAYFLSLVGWKDQEFAVFQKIITLDPTNCNALANLSSDPTTGLLYATRYQQSCR